MSGWIVPAKDGYTNYTLNSNTFYITTESVTGSSDVVDFSLYTDSGYITNIMWRFSDWGYYIQYCTTYPYYSLKFPVTPPTDVKKTWEITFTKEDVKIKCNTKKVLHFIFNNTHNGSCTSEVKGKIATRILFSTWDNATKMFNADQVGKLCDMCIHYII